MRLIEIDKIIETISVDYDERIVRIGLRNCLFFWQLHYVHLRILSYDFNEDKEMSGIYDSI